MEKYAVVVTGGKQYKVTKDLIIKVERLDVMEGDVVELPVLLVSDDNGTKCGVDAAATVVKATVLGEGKGKKVDIFKYKSKKNVRKHKGHRQPFTALKVISIEG